MDAYPLGSLDHTVPLVVASGLTSRSVQAKLDESLRDDTAFLRSDMPLLDTQEAEILEEYFAEADEQGKSWTNVSRDEPFRLRIKSVGRTFALPQKKAKMPPEVDSSEATPLLHSPFSPLSPVSSLYPDGLMNAAWMQKHQELTPAVYICFYSLTMDPTTATLEDNKLKADVNNIKATLTNGGYKTRLAIVFLQKQGDASTLTISENVQERLESIRKGTAMDPKSMFYVAPQETPDDLRSVAHSILTNLYGSAIEYYRDLGRHARKKRSRGVVPQPTVPPTSGTSQTLSLPDWNFRYDFKTALFSEFRQELDPALRSYDHAYDILLGQDVLEFIPSWSPRWNDARLLSDIICIRSLRLHLWMGQPSLAVRRWQSHRDRIGDFVDRRGNGTNNYGWQAWEARWAIVMANLIEKLEIPALAPSTLNLFLQPEKAVLGERLQPWELLHHTGYWYRIAARHLRARRTLANMIPDEDRVAPDSSTSQTSKTHYDTYLCPAPYQEKPLEGDGVDHAQLIIDCLIAARTQFQGRNQLRIASELALECAREMAAMQSWKEVLALLRPMWEDSSFRSEGWIDVSEELCWLMRRAAAELERSDLLIAIDWELLNRKFTPRPHWTYDLSKSLVGIKSDEKPNVSLSDETSNSFISTSFLFGSRISKAGDTCKAQFTVLSQAMPGSTPVTLSKLRVKFHGSLAPLIIEHDASAVVNESTATISIAPVKPKEEFDDKTKDDLPSKLFAKSNLTLNAGERRVYELDIPLRIAGDVEAAFVTYWYAAKAFDIDYTASFRQTDPVPGWYVAGSSKARKTRLDSRSLQVQPRPPKMNIVLPKTIEQFYANEPIHLHVNLENNESEKANVRLGVTIAGNQVPAFRVKFNSSEHESTGKSEESEARINAIPLGSINSASETSFVLEIDPAATPTLYDITVQATYNLESDSATPIIQSLPIQLNLVNAFEANYDLVPRLHSEPWPSLFDYEGLEEEMEHGALTTPRGLIQKWSLLCHFASFAQTDLQVMDTELKVLSTVGGAQSTVVRTSEIPDNGLQVAPKTMHEAQFDLMAQRHTLEDRSAVSLELAFVIRWKRDGALDDDEPNTTAMPVGKYLVLGAEPRVLATALYSSSDHLNMMQLDLTLENPSNHLLTFGLTMEPSDEFAFSGAKQTTLHLVPMSRRVVTYRLLPLRRGAYIRPGLAVRDKYFQKVLRIIPTEGMKIDKDGLLVWVPGAAGEEEAEDT